jgi:hypothetical protein
MVMNISDIISLVFGIGAICLALAPIPKTNEIISDVLIAILTLFKFIRSWSSTSDPGHILGIQ